MTSASFPLGVEPNLIAVSTGADARWSWQLITRSGRLLQQSADTFPSLTEALVDGRRHLEAAHEAARLRDEDVTGRSHGRHPTDLRIAPRR